MRIRIEFKSRYRDTWCSYCNCQVYEAKRGVPGWVSEWIGNRVSWLHRQTTQHKANRPIPGLAPAPVIDPEALERRRKEAGDA